MNWAEKCSIRKELEQWEFHEAFHSESEKSKTVRNKSGFEVEAKSFIKTRTGILKTIAIGIDTEKMILEDIIKIENALISLNSGFPTVETLAKITDLLYSISA